MARAESTNAEPSEVQQHDVEPDPMATAGPRGWDRPIWLLAGALFAVAGVIWVVTGSDPPVIGIIFVAVGMLCTALAAGFARRR